MAYEVVEGFDYEEEKWREIVRAQVVALDLQVVKDSVVGKDSVVEENAVVGWG